MDDNTPEIDISDILTKTFRIRSYVAQENKNCFFYKKFKMCFL